MNSNTKIRLQIFAKQIEVLAVAVSNVIGTQTCADIQTSAED